MWKKNGGKEMRDVEAVDKYNWSGEKTHTDYYDRWGNKIGSSVERRDLSGRYTHSDLYDRHGRKVGTAR